MKKHLPSVLKTKQVLIKITANVSIKFASLVLLFAATGLLAPIIVNAQPTDTAYFAVYCPGGGGLSTTYAADNVLTCHEGGSSPLFESSVASLTTNPNGEHFVTVVEADCYPDTSQVPHAPATPTGHIDCGSAPDATLTLGSTFPAKSAPSPAPPGPSGSGSASADLSPLSGSNLPQAPANGASLQNVLSIAFGIIGALGVLMIVVAGLRYVLSAGDPQKTAQARNAIIYALVGVVVAITAEAIVHFVVGGI